MLATLPVIVQNLFMGSPAPSAAGTNFVQLSFNVAGVPTPAVAAYPPSAAASLAALSRGAVSVIDKFSVDLGATGYTRRGAFLLTLAASTPVTVDLTHTTAATASAAGDAFFGTVMEVAFINTGSADVVVTPGASHPFAGPLSGTSPAFTVPAGSRQRWHSPAGWPVTAVARTLTFDPGAAAASLAVCVGGGF